MNRSCFIHRNGEPKGFICNLRLKHVQPYLDIESGKQSLPCQCVHCFGVQPNEELGPPITVNQSFPLSSDEWAGLYEKGKVPISEPEQTQPKASKKASKRKVKK